MIKHQQILLHLISNAFIHIRSVPADKPDIKDRISSLFHNLPLEVSGCTGESSYKEIKSRMMQRATGTSSFSWLEGEFIRIEQKMTHHGN